MSIPCAPKRTTGSIRHNDNVCKHTYIKPSASRESITKAKKDDVRGLPVQLARSTHFCSSTDVEYGFVWKIQMMGPLIFMAKTMS